MYWHCVPIVKPCSLIKAREVHLQVLRQDLVMDHSLVHLLDHQCPLQVMVRHRAMDLWEVALETFLPSHLESKEAFSKLKQTTLTSSWANLAAVDQEVAMEVVMGVPEVEVVMEDSADLQVVLHQVQEASEGNQTVEVIHTQAQMHHHLSLVLEVHHLEVKLNNSTHNQLHNKAIRHNHW